MWRMTQDAIDSGTSLIIFPEAMRTRDGHLNPFQDGGFRVAQQLGVPIVPVSLVARSNITAPATGCSGPQTVTVVIHDTIETKA